MFVLRQGIGYGDGVDGALVQAVDGVAAEDAVADEGVDPGGALVLQQASCARDGVAGVGEVVHEDGGAILNVANEHHGRFLLLRDFRRAAFLVRGNDYRVLAYTLQFWVGLPGIKLGNGYFSSTVRLFYSLPSTSSSCHTL